MSVYHRILVPLDASELSDRVLDTALATAAWSGADVLLLSVHAQPPGLTNEEAAAELARIERECATLVARARTRPHGEGLDGRVTAEVHAGDIAEAIATAVEERFCDVVVMGTHGRSGVLDWLTGSTTEQVLRKVPATVFVVRPEGYPYLRD